MANKRITELTQLDEQPALDDWLEMVDVSDTTDHASGSTFKVAAKRLETMISLANTQVWTDDTPPSDVVWIPGCVMSGSDSTIGSAVDRIFAAPFVVVRPITITQMTVEVTTAQASSICRLGIYEGDGSYFSPHSLKLDAGTVDSSTTGQKDITALSTTLEPGVYWSLITSDTASVSVRAYLASTITASVWDVGAGVAPYPWYVFQTVSGAASALPATVNITATPGQAGVGGWAHPIGYKYTEA